MLYAVIEGKKVFFSLHARTNACSVRFHFFIKCNCFLDTFFLNKLPLKKQLLCLHHKKQINKMTG